ncbi:MAG: TerB family tellurite resistance protein [Deltaproteobacteria bacterium]|nr:TerB family tellurite resistance protein [Deltaproteobacteria bacterium]
MLAAIQRFFVNQIDPGHRDVRQADQHRLQVATGALLVEMMRTDVECTEGERAVVLGALRDKFDLTEEETRQLMELAEAEADDAIDHYQFTSLIKTGFSQEQKRKVVEYLWAVAYADANVDKHEEYLVRKIANLIGVSHKEFIEAKLRVRDGGLQ